ncbi:Gwt1 protein [Candida orthopsilosis Co 90-125]|uniref:GPI-anchored wall transfer protein n=1 Tax=Candida orthopsilosis (strain 90-125) TaxID=1136231 RepID=H8WYE4_CANO9|nr:Gwt1 protein [Candida orthopsilosis Co 90-125]CCG21259.1 Gwt1 protein [Candida orthopsilosis Co 90-125]
MSSLKQLKENFVSDLTGGSIEEIYLVTSVALTSYLAYKFIKDSIIQLPLVYDYVINVLTILTAITIYSNNPTFLHYSIFLPSLLVYLLNHYTTENKQRHHHRQSNKTNDTLLTRKQFLTAYRSHMLIITNLAILAVDFKIFPRRFAKVETWGTSMMDLGVGSFVYSMGLVNSRQLIKAHSQYKFSWKAYLKIIKQSTTKAFPLLVLGFARFVSVKQLEYQEHVTEYGIHWNFFITLGLLPVLLGVLDPFLTILPRVVVAFIFIALNELLLKRTNVLQVILSGENRMNNFITMNKEGIYSFLGYFTIFIFGQSFGSFVLTEYPTRNNLISISKTKAFRKNSNLITVTTTQGLIIATVFYQALFTIVNNSNYFTSISRRLANASYVLWVVSYNATFLLGYNLIDRLLPVQTKVASNLLEGVNNNGLLAFLLGNLLTGLINMLINTLEVSNTVAFLILIGYSAAWISIVVILNHKHIYIKL